MAGEFRITGKHVLAIMVGFFLVIIAVNMVFVTVAVRSFPGEKEKKSYLQGLDYNTRLEQKAAQIEAGWVAAIETVAREGEQTKIELAFRDRQGRPVDGLVVSGLLARPADDDFDRELQFQQAKPGLYRVNIEAVDVGLWVLTGQAEKDGTSPFRFETKIEVP